MIGRVLGGRYAVEERVGGGGMATVYRGLDTLLDRPVALKVLRSQLAGDPDFVRRFRREARAAASLSHPSIIAVYDVGSDEGGCHYIVQEFVDGRTLKDRILREGPLPPTAALAIMQQVLDALGHAHRVGVIHRDVKPQNVLLTRDGRAKVADFGIALAETTGAADRSYAIVGTAHYAAPEQVRGGPTDERSDIYSAGVMFYEMLTGRLPFPGAQPVAVAVQQLTEEPPDPAGLRPLPPGFSAVVARAMRKAPEERYRHIGQFREDIEALAAGLPPVHAREEAARPAAPSVAPTRAAGTPAEGTPVEGAPGARPGAVALQAARRRELAVPLPRGPARVGGAAAAEAGSTGAPLAGASGATALGATAPQRDTRDGVRPAVTGTVAPPPPHVLGGRSASAPADTGAAGEAGSAGRAEAEWREPTPARRGHAPVAAVRRPARGPSGRAGSPVPAWVPATPSGAVWTAPEVAAAAAGLPASPDTAARSGRDPAGTVAGPRSSGPGVVAGSATGPPQVPGGVDPVVDGLGIGPGHALRADPDAVAAYAAPRVPARAGGRWLGWTIALLVLAAAAVAGFASLRRFTDLGQVQVPALAGQPLQAAEARLQALGLTWSVATQHSEVPEGRVLATDPPAGTAVRPGRQVQLWLSLGPPEVVVPPVAGLSEREAGIALTGLGLTVRVARGKTYSVTVPAGFVVSTDPPAGSRVPGDATVTVAVSAGPPPLTGMPDYVGLAESAVVRDLSRRRLVLGQVNGEATGWPAGIVAATTPVASASVAPGTRVNLTVSTGCVYTLPVDLVAAGAGPSGAATAPVLQRETVLVQDVGDTEARTIFDMRIAAGHGFRVHLCWSSPQGASWTWQENGVVRESGQVGPLGAASAGSTAAAPTGSTAAATSSASTAGPSGSATSPQGGSPAAPSASASAAGAAGGFVDGNGTTSPGGAVPGGSGVTGP